MSRITSISLRYTLLATSALYVFLAQENNILYTLFTPLTVYSVYGILHQLGETVLLSSTLLLFNGSYIELIPACIGGLAYFLLLALVLATPLSWKRTIYLLITLWISFLVINILRIVVFAVLVTEGYRYFNQAHMLVWILGGTLFVVLIWIMITRLFKIQAIPFYTDVLFLKNKTHRIWP